MTGTTLQPLTCQNCGNQFTENFCNRCGQKEAHRFTVKHVVHDVVHVFLHADKGIFPFMSRLVLYPGVMAREFVQGKRRMFNPFQYLILIIGLMLFLMAKAQVFETLKAANAKQAAALPSYFQKGMASISYVFERYGNIVTFITLPVYGLFSWVMFQKRKENFAEHLVIMVFAFAQVSTINVLVYASFILFNITGMTVTTVGAALTVVSFIITYKQFYNLGIGKAVWKGIVIYTLSYLVQLLLFMIALIAYILILKNSTPH